MVGLATGTVAVSTSQNSQPTPSSSVAANPYVSQAKHKKAAPKSQYLSSRQRIQRALPQKKATNTLHAMFSRQRSANAGETERSSEIAEIPSAAAAAAAAAQAEQTLTASSPAVGINLGSALKATASIPVTIAPPPPLSQAEEENLCIICEEATKRVVLLPCKHLCLCSACSKLEQVKDCPMCRTEISDRMEVFM